MLGNKGKSILAGTLVIVAAAWALPAAAADLQARPACRDVTHQPLTGARPTARLVPAKRRVALLSGFSMAPGYSHAHLVIGVAF
jgi:hypothetical protein